MLFGISVATLTDLCVELERSAAHRLDFVKCLFEHFASEMSYMFPKTRSHETGSEVKDVDDDYQA